MSDNWVKWELFKDLNYKYYIDVVLDSDQEGLLVELSQLNDTNKIRILFQNWVWSYRYVQEIFAINRLSQVTKRYGDNFLKDQTFFKITNSRYLQLLAEESDNISNYYGGAIHFCFVGADSVLDIIATYEPKIEIVKKNR